MFLAAFLIGLREGLEAALVVGILIAFARRQGLGEQVRRIWLGVAIAVVGSLAVGASVTFGRYELSFTAQEVIGGVMSILAAALITWMALWMLSHGHRMKGDLETAASAGLAAGGAWSLAWIALVSVGREGLETTVMLWGWALQTTALTGALSGLVAAVGVGYLLFRGVVRLNFARFFVLTGGVLLVMAAGVLAYGIGDLQEAAVLAGPFSGHPITPTDLRTGEVLVGLTDGPYWMASFPFGWAFDLSNRLDPTGWVASLLQGTVGLAPRMSWLQVLAWLSYLSLVLPRFVARARVSLAPRSRPSAAAQPATV